MSEIDVQAALSAEFMSAVRWRAGADWHPRPHSHPFCEVIVVLEGVERACIAGSTVYCDTGHVLFYPPCRIHEEWQEGAALLEFFCVEFEWKDCPDDMPHLIRDRQGRILELARWLETENFAHYVGDVAYRHLVMRMLVGELLRLTVSPSQEIVERVRTYVHGHLAEPFALGDLAASCEWNKFRLVRAFRTLTGLTPMEYVRLVRLDTARRLLLTTDLPLKEIAPRVGIADEYHLSRLLKSRYGRGVRELRRQTREMEAQLGEGHRLKQTHP